MTALITNVTQTGANNGALVLAAQNSKSNTDASSSDSKPDTTINGLPREILELVFSWLDPKSVARADQVCKYWRGIISDPFQSLWKQMRSVGPFSGVMIPITIERPIPQEFDYRANVASTWPLEGELRLYTEEPALIIEKVRDERSIFSPQPRWGRDEAEPFLRIIISNEESKEEFRRSGVEPGPELRGPAGSWQNSYSKLPGGFFPEFLPLRFFYKKDGSIANVGDKIPLKYQGQVVILTCQNRYTGEDQMSFPEQVTDRINVAIWINRLTQEQVNEAIRLAQEETRALIASE